MSQGKKWCDYCKIFIANNASSLRNHEIGVRHKEAMAQRLTTMRKDNVAKEKEKQKALKDLERIEQVCLYHGALRVQLHANHNSLLTTSIHLWLLYQRSFLPLVNLVFVLLVQ